MDITRCDICENQTVCKFVECAEQLKAITDEVPWVMVCKNFIPCYKDSFANNTIKNASGCINILIRNGRVYPEYLATHSKVAKFLETYIE